MSNMRIVTHNVADRGTVTASSTAGLLAAANLLTDLKSDVWRATGPVASLYAVWPAAENVQVVALPFCNLSPTATIRVRLTNETPTTNMLAYSQAFDNAIWSKDTGGAVAANVTTAPDGTTTADAYTHGTSTGNFAYLSQTLAGDASQAWTYSVWVRVASGTSPLALAISNVTGATKTGTAQGVSTTWKRLSFSVAAGQLANTSKLGVGIAGSPGAVYQVWGAQLEAGMTATSYYPSTNTFATRPTGYIDTWQTYAYDSGVQPACPAPAVGLRGWTAAQAASAYAYGGGACARMWLPAAVQATGLAVDIADPNNLQGYVEAARLVAGPYWSPTYNASDASMTIVDTTSLYRTDAGDQGAEAGYSYRRVPVNLSAMPAADRTAFVNIVRNSTAYPILLSVYPESADLALERDHMVYGRRSKGSDVALQYAASYSTTIEIEEI